MTITGARKRLGLGIALGAVLAFAAGAAPAPGLASPQIKKFEMNLKGHGAPGPRHWVEVKTKVRVCGERGPMRLSILEQQTGFDHPPTVIAENQRKFVSKQSKPCQLYTPSWRLGLKFFGVGIYKVRIRAVDKNGDTSREAVEKVKTFD